MVRGSTAILMLAFSSVAFAGAGGMQSSQAQQPSGQNFPPATKAGVNEDSKEVDAGASHTTTDKAKRVLKIGVTQITSSTSPGLSVDGLQQELFNDINFLGAKAVIIPSDPNDRDASDQKPTIAEEDRLADCGEHLTGRPGHTRRDWSGCRSDQHFRLLLAKPD